MRRLHPVSSSVRDAESTARIARRNAAMIWKDRHDDLWLAPFYDLVSVVQYDGLDHEPAMAWR
jgi:hypothetical protein